MLDLGSLALFVKVAELRSVTAAANELQIAQPSVSRKMKRLSDQLGVQLFTRNGRTIELSEHGLIFLEHARNLLAEAHDLEDLMRSKAAIPTGPLSVGLPHSFTATITEEFAVAIRAEQPRVQVCVVEGTSLGLRAALLQKTLDLAIVTSMEPDNDIVTRSLVTEPMMLIGPEAAQLSEPVALQAVLKFPLILTPQPNSMRKITDRAFGGLGAAPKLVLETNTGLSGALVARGAGYTVLPYSALISMQRLHDLSAAPIQGLTVEWQIVRHKKRPETAACRIARELIVRLVEKAIDSREWPFASVPKLRPD